MTIWSSKTKSLTHFSAFTELQISDNGIIVFGDEQHDVTPVSERQQFPYGSAPNNGKAIIAPAFADYKGEGDSPGATKGIVYYKVSLLFLIKNGLYCSRQYCGLMIDI